MSREVLHLVARLRDRTVSRNRDFALLATAPGRRALRIARRLAGLERELRTPGVTVEMIPLDTGVRLSLCHPAVRCRRDAFLTHDELALIASAGLPVTSLAGSGSRSREIDGLTQGLLDHER